MKKLLYPMFVLMGITLLLSAGCQKKGSADKTIDPESVVTVSTGTEGEEVSGVPAVIIGATAGCYQLEDDGSMTYVMSLERFAEVLYLQESGEFTYIYQEKERSGEFLKCLVDRDGEMETLWILDFNVKPEAGLGVVLNNCLLYSKDRLDKLTDKELTTGTIVLTDITWKAGKFSKIWVPELGGKEFYIQAGDFSSQGSDIQVAMLYHAAKAMGDGKEKQKRQLLQNALDNYPSSPLINLITDELNMLDGNQSGAATSDDIGEGPSANNGPDDNSYEGE